MLRRFLFFMLSLNILKVENGFLYGLIFLNLFIIIYVGHSKPKIGRINN
jgi:hypothetical protein